MGEQRNAETEYVGIKEVDGELIAKIGPLDAILDDDAVMHREKIPEEVDLSKYRSYAIKVLNDYRSREGALDRLSDSS